MRLCLLGVVVLTSRRSLTFRDDGYLYATSQGSNAVLRYSGTTGEFVDAVVPSGSGGLSDPCGLAFDSDGNLYVTTNSTAQVLRYGQVANAVFTVT